MNGGLPILEDWYIFPWAGEKRCSGEISGDARFEDGRRVVTSPIVSGPSQDESGITTIKTRSGTVYVLGEPA